MNSVLYLIDVLLISSQISQNLIVKAQNGRPLNFLLVIKMDDVVLSTFKFDIHCVNLEKPIFCFYQTGHKIQRTEAGSKIKILFRP